MTIAPTPLRLTPVPPLRAVEIEGPSKPSPSPAARPQRSVLMRKVEIACLLRGETSEASYLVPALPAFDAAFAAFARGTLFATGRGPVAVEDLQPGEPVRVAGGMLRPLLWRGSTMIVPAGAGRGQGQDPAMGRLTRIAADAVGVGRPTGDLVLGPWARVVHRGAGARPRTGQDVALLPAASLADGVGIIEIVPPAPVEVFHLGFERHERLLAQGVEVESHHPGPAAALELDGDLLGLWLRCFPHRPDLAAFGPLCLPRMEAQDLDLDDAA